jgi:hypothetical protein
MAGRPTIYSEKVTSKAEEYIESCKDEVEDYHKTRGRKA